MPKSNLCKPRVDPRLDEITRMITGGMGAMKLSQAALAKKAGMSQSTMSYRLSNPETWTIKELFAVMAVIKPHADEKMRVLFKEGEYESKPRLYSSVSNL